MGYTTALDLAAHAPNLETAIRAHFASNCFPPIPEVCVEPAVAAIRACEDERPEDGIRLPVGVEHRVYGITVPAHLLVEAWHLDAFVQWPEAV